MGLLTGLEAILAYAPANPLASKGTRGACPKDSGWGKVFEFKMNSRFAAKMGLGRSKDLPFRKMVPKGIYCVPIGLQKLGRFRRCQCSPHHAATSRIQHSVLGAR